MSSTNSSFVGLQNQGATGYLNSLIQTLFLTPEFRQELFSLTPNEVGLSNIEDEKDEKEDKKAIKPKRKTIIVELQKLFARLQSSIALTDALSTKSLTNAFGWKDDQVLDQHDINELYNLLLDGIESQMPNNKKILNKYYKGKMINIIKCQICQSESKRYEEFVQLNVILQSMQSSFDTLNDSLLSAFVDNIEELKHENAYFCVNCNKKVFAKKYCRLINLPTIMVCNLNRFYYDLKFEERVKINKKFKFPKSLDLSMFVENAYNEMDSSDIAQYDLIGIVVHRGSGANAGHYHAYIRDMNNEVMWKPIKRNKRQSKYKRRRNRRNRNSNTSNRNNHNEKCYKDARKKEQKEQAMAILVSILSENEVLTRNQLHQQFRRANNLTGWNDSSYQSVLRCSFSDFLRNNHRFKIIDGDKRTFSVCLANRCRPPKNKNKNKPKKNKKNKKKDDLDGFVVSDDATEEQQSEEYSHRNKNKNKNKKSADNKNEMDINKPHWFDFNDEDITAVFEDEIDDLYDGGDDECPYMLIYRKKCMNTEHWPPQIPTFVESLLVDEPLDSDSDSESEDDIDLQMNSKDYNKILIVSSDDAELNLKLNTNTSNNKKRKRGAIDNDNDNSNLPPSKKQRISIKESEKIKILQKENENLKTGNENLKHKIESMEANDMKHIDSFDEDKLNELELNLENKMKLIKEARERLMEDKFKCIACLINQKNIVIEGCNHLDLCDECESKLEKKVCPRCQKIYTRKIKLNNV